MPFRHHQQPGADQHDRPALSPVEIEKQITFPIETAWPASRASNTPARSRATASRRSLRSSATRPDIYFARQQVNERLTETGNSCRRGRATLGPISTGLGEIYMWTVEYEQPPGETQVADGKPGWQSDGSYLTPEGERSAQRFRTHRVSAHRSGLDHPAAAERRDGCRRRRCHRRLREAVSCPARSDEARSPTASRSPISSRRSRGTMSAAARATSSTTARPIRARRRADRELPRSTRSSSPRAAACRYA